MVLITLRLKLENKPIGSTNNWESMICVPE